ncbi:MAG: protein kinase [Candidatus Aminicenantes bacterium]|nr:protein kinase [Candidatus Aminicenantes bacterium]
MPLTSDARRADPLTKTLATPRPVIAKDKLIAGKYRVLEEIGRGGMGVVFKAEDVKLQRTVALKFLPYEWVSDPDVRERFIQEARAASALDHNNICTIYEIAETEDDRMYIAMAFYEGESLKDRLGRGPLDVAEAMDIAVQVAQGMAKAHKKGIIHRDIKPANLLITTDGVVKVVDFGLAKLSGQVKLTREGTTVGTVAYMSPEQARGEDIDQRTDIWALGVVFYETLTGELPFHGANEQSMIFAILNTRPKPASELNKSIPSEVEHILTRALAKDPDQRYDSAADMLDDLDKARAGAPIAPADITDTAEAKKSSVAVVNFLNISADPETDWLSDGIAETVTVDLKKISSLSVVSREKVLQAQKALADRKAREESVIDLGRKLGVRWIVWGGFQKHARDIRMTAHFTDMATGNLAGSAKVDGTMDDIFKLQDEIVARLIGTMKLEVSDSELRKIERPETVEVEAYEYYVRGRQLLHQMGKEDIPKAIEYFKKAIDLDPDYALAYSGLGSIHMIMYIAQTHHEDLEKGISFLQAAITHDPDIADPHLWLTYGYARDHRFEEAIRSGRQAVHLEPENPLSHYFLGVAFMLQGVLEYKIENYPWALKHFKINCQLQPNYQPAHMNAAWIFLLRGLHQEAREALSQAVTIEESGKPALNRFVGALTLMGNLHLRQGQLDLARTWYERSLALLERVDHVYREPFQSLTYCGLGALDFSQGRYDKALLEFKRAEDLISRNPRSLGIGYFLLRSYLGQARAYFALGDISESKKYFEKALELFRTKQGFDFNWIWEGCDAQVHYDIAGYFALLNKEPEVIENLRRAAALGWRDVPAFKMDELFADFRRAPSCAMLIDELEKEIPLCQTS